MRPVGWVRALLARRELVFGMNRRNIALVYEHNARTDYPLADDKLLAKEVLTAAGVPVPANLATCDGLFDLPRVLEVLSALEDFVVKPARGGGGNGILVVGQRTGPGRWRRAGGAEITLDDLHSHLANILFGAFARGALQDRAMVEPRIEPHAVYRSLWEDGLCDVRVITLRETPLLAMVRVPTARSGGRANLHQGGLGLAVELETGTVFRAVSRGQLLTHHPDSGAELEGIALPQWPESLDVAVRAARAVPLGYLGVDIVVDRVRGPVVLEINARPGLEIQNVNGRGLGEALQGVQ